MKKMRGQKDRRRPVQVSDSTMILTGGQGTDALVREYSNLGSAAKGSRQKKKWIFYGQAARKG